MIAATSAAACSNAPVRSGLGRAMPVTFRTYWRAAASISSAGRGRFETTELSDVSAHAAIVDRARSVGTSDLLVTINQGDDLGSRNPGDCDGDDLRISRA